MQHQPVDGGVDYELARQARHGSGYTGGLDHARVT
jgi:hypothetical protein